MTAVSVSLVAAEANVGRLAVGELGQRLGVRARRGGVRVGGEQHEVLAAPGAVEGRPAGLADGQLGGAFEAEVGPGGRVLQVVGDLPLGQQDVQRDHGRAGLQDAVVDDGEIGQVRAAEGDPVARTDAPGGQGAGHLAGFRVELGVGQPGRAAGYGHPVRDVADAVLEQDGKVEHGASAVGVQGKAPR